MFDLLVIGGGINGAAIAREAALRGLSVCLLEREDFGSGTTAASTRLIHGGLRYLRYGEIGLVREALREREILLRTMPHLVRPLTFLLPIYERSPYSAGQLRAGLLLYDFLSFDRSLPGHQALPRKRWSEWEPCLATEGLRALLAYADAQVEYPERLCLEYVLDAQARGAAIANHTQVTVLIREGKRVAGAVAEDRLTGETREVRARAVINAAGPWVDAVNALLPSDAALPRLIGAVKGSHVALPTREGGPRHAIYSAARRDGRPFFLLPWAGMLLIGTTEVVEPGAPEQARCTPQETEYLLAEANALFPALALRPEDLSYTYAGLRPLPAARGPAAAITRRHFVVDHAAHGAPGLFSVVGGKLSTAQSLAEKAVLGAGCWVLGKGGRRFSRKTAGPRPHPAREERREARAADDPIESLYGARAPRVRALAVADPDLARPLCPHSPAIAAQVRFAVEEELARTLADVCLRRTMAGLAPCLGRDAAPAIARLMAPLLGWDDARVAAELADYEAIVRQRLP
jgi:glycerol-3-phosphate dehydrogenase